MDLSQVVMQTDNGSEFVSHSPDLFSQSAFEQAIDHARSTLSRIPPWACASEVDRSDGTIEHELLGVERWSNKSERVAKTTAGEYDFNHIRPHSCTRTGHPISV